MAQEQVQPQQQAPIKVSKEMIISEWLASNHQRLPVLTIDSATANILGLLATAYKLTPKESNDANPVIVIWEINNLFLIPNIVTHEPTSEQP